MSPNPVSRVRRLWRNRFLLIPAGLCLFVLPVHAAKPGKIERREMKGDAGGAEAKVAAKPTGEDAQARILAKLREQFEVADDAEWAVISERVGRVNELRRGGPAGGAGLRGGGAVAEKSKRLGGSTQQEQEALRAAVRDKLPDAEIKARLARMHDVHQQNETKLTRAQEELRAVLTVRQEAIAVMAGLLPP
jgi:hypothetical protein